MRGEQTAFRLNPPESWQDFFAPTIISHARVSQIFLFPRKPSSDNNKNRDQPDFCPESFVYYTNNIKLEVPGGLIHVEVFFPQILSLIR